MGKDEINKLLTANVIWGSQSNWSASIIVVPKVNGGKCLLIDYFALNKITREFIWPMPKVEDIFLQLNGTKYFSTLKLQTGYCHILDESLIPKTAFTSSFGKYKYIKVPFRLAQAPAYFQELITSVLKDFPFTIAYLDEKIITAGLQRNTYTTSHRFLKNYRMLNYPWNSANATSLPKRSNTVDTSSVPQASNHYHQRLKLSTTCTKQKQPKQVCTFLGLVTYYSKFIKDFTKMAKPLTLLTHHKTRFEWTSTHHTVFMMLKEARIQVPILPYPDPARRHIAYTDASDHTCRAQLSQEHNGTKFPITFLSHTFTVTQRKWGTPEQEANGVYYAFTKWNYYLLGFDIIVCNDHKPLPKFLNGKNANNKVNRWGLELATYNITFKWILGAQNKAADCLFRLVTLPNDHKATVIMLRWTSIQHKKQNITAMPNTQGNMTSKHSIHHETCYIWLNHSGNHSGYYTITPQQLIDMMPYSRCRGQIHSVNISQKDYQMAWHHSMRLIYLHMLKDYYTNMSWMQFTC